MLAICDLCGHRHFRVADPDGNQLGATQCANEVCAGTICGPGGALSQATAATGPYALPPTDPPTTPGTP
jgi:hypothetical protein